MLFAMKIVSYLTIVSLLILSCEESEKGITIRDLKGISVELFWKGVEPKNQDGIGFVVYGPEGNLYYWGHDSLGFAYMIPDGRHTLQVELQYKANEYLDYIISVKGLGSDADYTFENSFNPTDGPGAIKTALFVTTDIYNYTLETP
jgi:hypothetical protein